jgi:acyl transferase domain-containing protein
MSRTADTTPETSLDGAIAIVGMAGRFPKARTLEQFWRNLADGVDCVTRFTPAELVEAGFDPAVMAQPDFVAAKALVDDPEQFDATLFGYQPTDASVMDPQQRVFLEVSWEALEHAGYDPDRYRGLIGAFAGTRWCSTTQSSRLAPVSILSESELTRTSSRRASRTS